MMNRVIRAAAERFTEQADSGTKPHAGSMQMPSTRHQIIDKATAMVA